MLSATTQKVQYTLTSATAALAVPFYFIENYHVRVVRTRSGVDTPLNGGFTLSGAGVASGGTLTLDGTETAVGDRITLKRVVPLDQLTSYAANDRFPASTHERALDRATMQVQQVEESVARALQYGEGEVMSAAKRLPSLNDRARRILGFDGDGDVDVSVLLDDIRTIIIANPVDELPDVTDYGSVADEVTSVADYGSVI